VQKPLSDFEQGDAVAPFLFGSPSPSPPSSWWLFSSLTVLAFKHVKFPNTFFSSSWWAVFSHFTFASYPPHPGNNRILPLRTGPSLSTVRVSSVVEVLFSLGACPTRKIQNSPPPPPSVPFSTRVSFTPGVRSPFFIPLLFILTVSVIDEKILWDTRPSSFPLSFKLGSRPSSCFLKSLFFVPIMETTQAFALSASVFSHFPFSRTPGKPTLRGVSPPFFPWF